MTRSGMIKSQLFKIAFSLMAKIEGCLPLNFHRVLNQTLNFEGREMRENPKKTSSILAPFMKSPRRRSCKIEDGAGTTKSSNSSLSGIPNTIKNRRTVKNQQKVFDFDSRHDA